MYNVSIVGVSIECTSIVGVSIVRVFVGNMEMIKKIIRNKK